MVYTKGLVILTKRDEKILRTISFYRYMTALDVTFLLYSPGSLKYVRDLLSFLAGKADYETNQYLYRFRLPSVSTGNSERIYTLGSRGRDYLSHEVGVTVNWHFRPDRTKHLGHGQLIHNLVLTRFLVAAYVWAKNRRDFKLAQTRICYELAQLPATVELEGEGRKTRLTVIPDAWLLFERVKEGDHQAWFPVLVEIDRGTQDQAKFRERLEARLEFIRTGAYKQLFGIESVRIAYATTGETPEYREARRRALCHWTKDVLAKAHKEKWGTLFRFSSVRFEEMYTNGLFEREVWYKLDEERPVWLLGS